MPETRPRAKKSLGQHFLVDPNYCRKIVRFAGITSQDTVLEIGPGTGQLTRALLEAAHQVVAVEFDRQMIAHLQQQLTAATGDLDDRFRLVEADILTLDWDAILGDLPVKIVGNLPYNISTRIIKRTTEVKDRFQSCTFMVQKEVAERILASPGNKDYGYFTLLMQYHFERMVGFDVPAGVFVPRPRVISHVLQLIPRAAPCEVPDYDTFVNFLKEAFRQRRKTLWNNLKRSHAPERLRPAFETCGIDPQSRADTVTLEQYACLVRVL